MKKSNEPNRALMILPTGMRGGAEAVCFSLIKELTNRGWHVDLLVMSRGMQPPLVKMLQDPNVKVIVQNYGSEKFSLPCTFFRIVCLGRKDYDLVYSTHLHVNAMLGLMRKFGALHCRRLVARESTVIFERFFGLRRRVFSLLYRLGYGVQNLLIVQTPEMLASLSKSVDQKVVAPARVIPNPIDIGMIESELAGGTPRQGERRRIVACGRLTPIKGFSALIDAFQIVAAEFPDYYLEIVGDGEERGSLLARVAEHGLGDRVVFHGYQEKPWRLLSNADVGIVSSVREGFPNALLEMMASSVKRVVSTPCTDWVRTIPNVAVADSVGVEDIGKALSQQLRSTADYSAEYRSYLQRSHSLRYFADVVLGAA